MTRLISEADWRVFRDVSARAIDQFCARALDDVAALMADSSRDDRDRLEAVARLTRERCRELEQRYLDFRRSTAVFQLCAMQAGGLLEREDIERFSSDVQARLAASAEMFEQLERDRARSRTVADHDQ